MQRTVDGRFVEERVRIAKDEIGEILRCVKMHNELTWRQLAEYLGVSEHTIKHDYHKKGNTIPLSIYKKIVEMYPETKIRNSTPVDIIGPFWGQKLNRPRGVKNSFSLEISTDFAEFYGMMLGDGCVYSNMNGLCITCDSELDAPYIKYFSSLIQKIFNVKPRIYNSSGSRSVRCVVYSREISRFMVRNEFPPGEKSLNFTAIPGSISGDVELSKSLIRGLTDTDGSVFPHPSAKIILEISIKNRNLLVEIRKLFENMNFPAKFTKDRVYFIGRDKVAAFFSFFGSSNMKHVLKYKIFLETGKVPKSIELLKTINQNHREKLPYFGPVV